MATGNHNIFARGTRYTSHYKLRRADKLLDSSFGRSNQRSPLDLS